MKIAVYAISKNEEKFVQRFYESAKEADEIVLLDTGSTDKTVELARALGIKVFQASIKPWRFDKARDISLSLVSPDVDVCICLDLDEVLNPGWRDLVTLKFQDPKVTRLSYLFDWSSGVVFHSDKIHRRNGYFWKGACHEVLTPDARLEEVFAQTNELLVSHYPDNTKPRSQYLDLLEVDYKENIKSPRHILYYGRELFFYCKYSEAKKILTEFLALGQEKLWIEEVAYAHRLLGQIYEALDLPELAERHYYAAVTSRAQSKSAWLALAEFAMRRKKWDLCFRAANTGLNIHNPELVYMREPRAHKDSTFLDLLALSSYYMGSYTSAADFGEKALALEPEDTRLQNNLAYYKEKVWPEPH